MSKANLVIYACGGCGLNIAQEHLNIPIATGYIKTSTVLIDTSDSNHKEDSGFPFYKIPGVEGMGKSQKAAAHITGDKIDPILKAYKPGSLNVVICSAGGGTGSVTGLMIVRELLKRGLPTVLALIASTSTGKESENSYKSLMSLQKFANKLDVPLPFFYYENTLTEEYETATGTGARSTIDKLVGTDIRSLAYLASEQHLELDRADVANFFFYSQVTDVKSQLVELLVLNSDEASELKGKAIATASILSDKEKSAPDLDQPYGCVGFIDRDIYTDGDNTSGDVTWVLTTCNLSSYAATLKKATEAYKAAAVELSSFEGIDIDELEDDVFGD